MAKRDVVLVLVALLAALFVAQGASAIDLQQIASVRNDSSMSLPYSIAVSGNYAYVPGQTTNSLAIFDISNPAAPVQVAAAVDGTYMNDAIPVTILNDKAYVAGANSNSLEIIDVSNPAAPVKIGHFKNDTSMSFPIAIAVKNDIAYVAALGNVGFVVVNVSNPAAPVQMAEVRNITSMQNIDGIAVSGTRAYVVSQGYFSVFDISNPAAPVQVGVVEDGTELDAATSVTLAGNFAYVTNAQVSIGGHAYGDSLSVFDISNPAAPIRVGFAQDHVKLAGANAVAVLDNKAYVASTTANSVTIFEGSTPSSPTEIGYLNNDTSLSGAAAVAAKDRFVFVVASMRNSLTVLETPCTPSWSCSAFDVCQPGDSKACLAVSDANTCGQTFNGSLSAYNASCSYVAPAGNTTPVSPSNPLGVGGGVAAGYGGGTPQEPAVAPQAATGSTSTFSDWITSIWNWIVGLFS